MQANTAMPFRTRFSSSDIRAAHDHAPRVLFELGDGLGAESLVVALLDHMTGRTRSHDDVMINRESAWDAVHEALPAGWTVGPPGFDAGVPGRSVTQEVERNGKYDSLTTHLEGVTRPRRTTVAAIEDLVGGLPLRHSACHTLDHALEMADKDLTGEDGVSDAC